MYPHMISKAGEGAYAPAFAQSRDRLRKLDINRIEINTRCIYKQEAGCFIVQSFGQSFEISYPDGAVCFQDHPGCEPELWWSLILLNYLSAAKDIAMSNEWVSYRELPSGNVFFPAIKRDVIGPMGVFYGSCNKEILLKALQQIGFVKTSGRADLTAVGWFAPRVPVSIQFWDGEEEIPSSFQLLFDSSLGELMHIEDCVAICEGVKRLVMNQYAYVLSYECS